jgi:cytochrome c oxidase assembly factor CtaG
VLSDQPYEIRCDLRDLIDSGTTGVQSVAMGMDVMALSAGPPPLTWGRLLTAWTPNVGALVVEAVLGVAYGLGVRRLRRRGVEWPAGRSWWFATGLGSVLLVTVSVIGVYADVLFWDRAVQNIVLLMITPMLLALGAPLTLLREVLPGSAQQWASRALHSAPARALTFPAVVTVALIAPLFVLYLTPLYEASLRSAVVGGMTGAGLVGAGFLYFWTVGAELAIHGRDLRHAGQWPIGHDRRSWRYD